MCAWIYDEVQMSNFWISWGPSGPQLLTLSHESIALSLSLFFFRFNKRSNKIQYCDIYSVTLYNVDIELTDITYRGFGILSSAEKLITFPIQVEYSSRDNIS